MTYEEAKEIIKTAIAEVEWNYPMEYAAAFEKAIKALERQPIEMDLPCKIGDTAYGIRRFHDIPKIQKGTISEMYFLPDMRLQIVIKYICRGSLGENIFLTYEEAEKALKEREENA